MINSMSVFVEIRDTVLKDIHDLEKTLQEQDRKELQGLSYKPLTSLFKCYRGAVYRKTAIVDGEVAAIWGVSGTLFGIKGSAYFITGNALKKVPVRTFLSYYKEEFDKIKDFFPIIEQYVDASYKNSLQLLKLLGFKWDITKRIKGHNGVEFVHVMWTKPKGITIQSECIDEVKNDIKDLQVQHAEELTYHREIKGLPDPNWELAYRLEQEGRFKILTVRDNDKLIGYFIYVLSVLPHYKHISVAQEDAFYLHPKYRGSSLGYKFIKTAIQEMENTGATVLKVTNKVKQDYKSIWTRLGFEAEEISYTKINKVS